MARLLDRLLGRPAERFAGFTPDEWTYLVSSYGLPSQERIDQTFVAYNQFGYVGNSVVFSVIGRRIALFSEATFKYRRLSDKSLFGDTSLAKLETPWPNGTTADLLARMEQDVSLAGNAYVRDAGSQLERLRPDWVTIVSEVTKDALGREVREVRGYLFEPVGDPDRSTEFYLVDEVAHFAPTPDPLANFRGMSWMTPVIRELDADNAMLRHQQAFYENSASPNMVIKYQGKLGSEQVERIRNAIAARHAGPRNAGGTMVLDQGADLTIVGDRMQGSAFTDLRAAGESRIASASGVPALIAGLREGMQASQVGEYAQAMRAFADLTARPWWRGACGALSVLVKVPAGAQLWYDVTDISALQPGEGDAAGVMQQQAATANTFITAGYEPDSVITAISANDLTLLKHSGMTSVQLYKPGENNTQATPDNPPPSAGTGPGDQAPGNVKQDGPPDQPPPKAPPGRHRRNFDPLEPRDEDGKWTDHGGLAGKIAKTFLTTAEMLSTYGPDYSEGGFGDDGHVRVFENGDFAVTFDTEDGKHELFGDGLDADGARDLASKLRWAATEDLDGPDYKDMESGPNELLDWQHTQDGILVGFYRAGDVRVGWPAGDSPDGEPLYDEIDLSAEDAADFADAVDSAADDLDDLAEE